MLDLLLIATRPVVENMHSSTKVIIIIIIHTHPFNGPFSGTTRVSRYQKGKANLDFIEERDSEWQ